ncbi:hypothetical protein MLD38_020957 [Melastoma candidum]|uniref:Uncharacterized protein n=1 Tax=Melastoma candidum TaxID=119954 RepID=A0ACB9QF34_9MYRT|nr:hypothetical protein MLD38_020957 [Melastoma candidum]
MPPRMDTDLRINSPGSVEKHLFESSLSVGLGCRSSSSDSKGSLAAAYTIMSSNKAVDKVDLNLDFAFLLGSTAKGVQDPSVVDLELSLSTRLFESGTTNGIVLEVPPLVGRRSRTEGGSMPCQWKSGTITMPPHGSVDQSNFFLNPTSVAVDSIPILPDLSSGAITSPNSSITSTSGTLKKLPSQYRGSAKNQVAKRVQRVALSSANLMEVADAVNSSDVRRVLRETQITALGMAVAGVVAMRGVVELQEGNQGYASGMEAGSVADEIIAQRALRACQASASCMAEVIVASMPLGAQKVRRGARCFARLTAVVNVAHMLGALKVPRAAHPSARVMVEENAACFREAEYVPRVCMVARLSVSPTGVANGALLLDVRRVLGEGPITVSVTAVARGVGSQPAVRVHREALIFARHMVAGRGRWCTAPFKVVSFRTRGCTAAISLVVSSRGPPSPLGKQQPRQA